MSEFKLLIDRLSDTPQRFAFEAAASWWSARAGGDEAVGDARVELPFGFEGVVHRLGEGVLIEGTLEGGISVECSRCSRRYAHALRDSFRLVLKPLKEDVWGDERAQEAIDPEGARAIAENGICLGDDLEAGWFRGPVIFLDDFFGEVAATSMPIQPLCEEDCPGLCPQCGMERSRSGTANEGAAVCGCADERVESPFAVLAGWKVSERVGLEESDSESEKSEKKLKGSDSGQRR